jgi:hypothetical protein
MIDIKDWLIQERDLHKKFVASGAWLMQEFLLRNGRKFYSQPKPKRYKMRTPKWCFHNATMLRNQSHGALRYAEGYVASPDLPLLIHHAWCVDAEDRVVDCTLQDWHTGESRSGAAQYFGIVFANEIKVIPPGGSFLDSGRGFRIDLWLAIDPDFSKVLDKASTRIFGAKASAKSGEMN